MSGLGLALAILIAGPRSGAHLNPALSFAFCLFRKNGLPLWELPIFMFSQLLGGMLGAALTLALYHHPIRLFEDLNGLVRGERAPLQPAAPFSAPFPRAASAQPSRLPPPSRRPAASRPLRGPRRR
eukprot:TRINITY_DN935_c0_g1_i6.p3 TRINITY_DN935_c0_g1~~TRINITY_DN935_c0_g1_i6.p3  ORF type:complete len:126 (+),score=28.00 TRINITY_DN935_c0_g1_i6:959-1336(+)